MRKIFLSLITVCLFLISKAQITKSNWLVGGSGTIARQQEKISRSDVKSTIIQLSPNLGYFVIDKFSLGLKPSIGYVDLKTNTYRNKTTSWAFGPFFRYYFLSAENRINLFAETDYQYSSSGGSSQNLFLFSGGPVIFFNSSVGIEFTANYKIYHSRTTATSSKTLFIGIGLQIHLEKEKE